MEWTGQLELHRSPFSAFGPISTDVTRKRVDYPTRDWPGAGPHGSGRKKLGQSSFDGHGTAYVGARVSFSETISPVRHKQVG